MWLELELRAGKKKGPETSHCKNRHLGTSQSHSRRNGQKTARGVRQRPARNEMREMRGFQAASPPRPSLPRSRALLPKRFVLAENTGLRRVTATRCSGPPSPP